MILEFIRRFIYGALVDGARQLTGVRIHHKAQYSHDYLHSARWYALRNIRLAMDGWQCTHYTNRRRCTMHTTLQMHHVSYRYRGAPGVDGFVNELLDLRTLCDAHHGKDS